MARYRATFDGERRTAKVTVQLAPTERERLAAAAKDAGSPLSEYVRELCLRRRLASPVVAGTTKNPDAKRLADEINAVGINLNQLTRIANQNGDFRRTALLEATIELVRLALTRVITL